MKSKIVKILALLLAALAAYSGYRLWAIIGDYQAEAEMHNFVLDYKPQADAAVNQGVMDLREKYPDVAGWLTVPNTNIDYPFVWYEDNAFYLRRDLNGEDAQAGTLFLDYRCKSDFTSQNTIIYGHNMKNGSMFGTLKSFADAEFFAAVPRGTVCFPNETLSLEFFAYLVVRHDDKQIYSPARAAGWLDYIKQNARQYRDIELSEAERTVTLSTCSYEFNNARIVLLAKVIAS